MTGYRHRIRGLCLSVFALAVLCGPATAARLPQIVVNQVGWLPNWPKQALLINAPVQHLTATLNEAKNGKAVFTLVPSEALTDPQSRNRIQMLDFSAFTQPGTYVLQWGRLRSEPFAIGRAIYEEPFRKLLRSYYLQRCGMAIDDPLTGIRHDPCHTRDGRMARKDLSHKAGAVTEATGGWHDAGDYGKYMATAAVTVGRLLNLFEENPDRFSDGQFRFPANVTDAETGMPQSRNNVPDILDEVRWELEWMLKMQRADGAVWRKLSGAKWPSAIPPQADGQPRLIYGISSPETAKFAGALAMAARIYPPYDARFSQRCLVAAKKSWAWLRAHPDMVVDWQQADDSGSGIYLFSEVDREKSLQTDADDRFWAAAELFISAGDNTALAYVEDHIESLPLNLFEWKDPSALGLTDLYRSAGGKGKWAGIIREKLLARADQLLKNIRQSGYRLANHRFVWGSNKMAAEEGIFLCHAFQMTGRRAYLEGAADQLAYLLGRNPFNLSFVSGVGTRPVRHVCHLFARAENISIPGLLVGGPNAAAQAGIAPKHRGPLSYADDARSYATNENAIDYNAAIIGLMGLMTGEKQRPGHTSGLCLKPGS